MATITIQLLERAGACSLQQDAFLELFPSGTTQVTVELAREHAEVFDWYWAVDYLLKSDFYSVYRGYRGEAIARRDAAVKAAHAAWQKAWMEDPADDFANAYVRATVRVKACTVAREAFRRDIAEGFARAYIEQEG